MPEEPQKNTYAELYKSVKDLLNFIQKGFDDTIAEYQSRIDTKSQKLLLDPNLSIADKAALVTEVAAAGALKATVIGAKFGIAQVSVYLAADALLPAVGLTKIAQVPGILRGLLEKVDKVLGINFLKAALPKLIAVEANIDNLILKFGNAATNISSHEIMYDGMKFSAHGLGRMMERGIDSKLVKEALTTGIKSAGTTLESSRLDLIIAAGKKGLRVVIDVSGRIITTNFFSTP